MLYTETKSERNKPIDKTYDKYFFQRQACREILAKEYKQITTFSDKETNVNSRVSPHGVRLKSA